MQKVPEAGYKIVGLKIVGLQRNFSLSNLSFPFKVLGSLNKSNQLINDFDPNAVVGVGGYASGPLLFAAQIKGVPTLIQEQNSYAGLTNKLLAKKANSICVAYPGMEEFFPKDKLHITGNPVRKDILNLKNKKQKAIAHFGLDPEKKVLLVLGGSLGARTINQAVLADMKGFEEDGYQVLWQCGKFYFSEMSKKVSESGLRFIYLKEFIKEMDLAYAAADVVISRAGALSVSELSIVGKPVVFIPSPNVAEDHQTKNAMAYVKQNAAILLKDDVAVGQLKIEIDKLMADSSLMEQLSANISAMAKPDAAEKIVAELESILE